MATTPVEFFCPSGLTLTIELYPYGSDTIGNTGGDSATEATNRKGLYSANVTEALAGWYTAIVKAGTTVVALYSVFLVDDTSIHRCHDSAEVLYTNSLTADAVKADAATEIGVATLTIDPSAYVMGTTGYQIYNGAAFASAAATDTAAIKTKTDYLPSATAGAAGGVFIAGSNAATTAATWTVSGATTHTGAVTATNASNDIRGIALSAAQHQIILKEIYKCSGTIWCVTPTGNDTTGDGLTLATAYATCKKAASVAAAADIIIAFSGTIAEGVNSINLPDGVSLFGAGVGATRITSEAVLGAQGPIVKPGTRSLIQDVTIEATLTDGTYQGCVGAYVGAQSAFTNAVVQRVHLIGDSDGVYINKSGTACSMVMRDSRVDTKYDAIRLMGNAANAVDLVDVHCTAAGPTATGVGFARAVAVRAGTLRMFGGSARASDSGVHTVGLETDNSTGFIKAYGVVVQMASAALEDVQYDVYTNGGSILVANCHYNTSSGSVTITPTHGVNVLQVSGDTTAADNAEAFFDGTGYAGTNNVIPNVTTVGTTTNLTNAATSGDLTNTMKASVTTAATAATPTAAAVTGNVGGKVLGGGVTAIQNVGAWVKDWEGEDVATAADLGTLATTVGTLVGKFAGITLLKNWLALIMGKTPDTGTRTEVNATTAGATYNETTDSQEAIRDRGDAAWTGGGGGGSTAEEIADAVWDEARSGHTTPGTFGEGVTLADGSITSAKIASSGLTAIAADVWDALTSGMVTVGSIGKKLADATWSAGGDATLAKQNEILARINPARVVYQGPVSSDLTATIIQGDDYLDADGEALSWIITDYTGPSVSGATASLRIMQLEDFNQDDTAAELSVTATAAMVGDDLVLKADLTAAQTAALSASPPSDKWNYVYQVVITLSNTHKITPARATGAMTVSKRIV